MQEMRRNQRNRRKDLSRIVYDYVVEQIKLGELIEQQRLTEYQISKELGVSRTPVRRAFRSLAADGYLENIENVGVHVKRQTLDARGFQERAEFLEKLLAYYLFELERNEFRFDEAALEEIIQDMQGQLAEKTDAFEKSCVRYFYDLVEANSNSYMKEAMIKTVRELFLNHQALGNILQDGRYATYEHLIALSDQLAQSNYPLARREIRILLNQLTLDIIEKS